MNIVCSAVLIYSLQWTHEVYGNFTIGTATDSDATITVSNSARSTARSESVCGNGTIRNGEEYVIQLMTSNGCHHALPYFVRCSDYSYRMFESKCVTGKILYMIACVILGFLTMTGNLLVIITFFKVKKLRNSQGIYKMSMAFTDLIFGVFVPPSVMISWMGGWRNANYLSALGFVTPFTTFSSMGMLIASGTDRLVAIILGIRCRPWVAKRCAYATVVFVWCISACVSSLPFYVDNVWFTYASTGTVKLLAGEPVVLACLAVAISAVYLNGIFLYIVIKIREREAAKIWSHHIFKRDRDLAITLCIMNLAFTSSTLPSMIFLTVNDSINTPLLIGEGIVVFFFMTNGFWNCIVYSFRHKEFRDELKSIFAVSKRAYDVRAMK